jgi:hypothetical protein
VYSDRWLFTDDELRERWELTQAGEVARGVDDLVELAADPERTELPVDVRAAARHARAVLLLAEQRAGVRPFRPEPERAS